MRFLLLFIPLSLQASMTTQKMAETYNDMIKVHRAINTNSCKKAVPSLKNIDKNFSELGKHYFIKSKGYKVSFKNFKRNIKELIHSCQPQFKDKEYRKSLFHSLTKSCFQCHSTDRIDRDGIGFNIDGSTVDKISFSLISRNYEKVERQIDNFFKKINQDELKEVLEVEQDLFLRIKNDPQALVKRYEKRKNLPQPWNWKINTWTFELKNLPRYKNPKKLYSSAENFIKKRVGLFVSESERIHLKYLLGRLNHLLHDAKKKQAPKILYYLGSLENRLDHSFYSVDNLYLMECLDQYPKSSYAGKCFDEFMAQVNFSFTGSKGTSIPDSVKELIKELTPIP